MSAYAAVVRAGSRIVFAVAAAMFALSAHAQTLTVYDDALQNGFDGPNYSFGGGFVFDDTAQHHAGTKSVSIIGHSFNALSFEHVPGGIVTTLHTADTPILRFWVNGGTASGQQFHIGLKNNNVAVGTAAALDTYINGGGVGLGVWRDVTIDLRQAPFNAVDFDRIDIQSDADAAHTDASATYFDDIVLGQPSAQVISPLVVQQNDTVAAMQGDRFIWQDSANKTREAMLSYNSGQTGPNGGRGGSLRQFKYQLPNGATRTAGITTYPGDGDAGFGYVVMHATGSNCLGDDSPIGGFAAGNGFERVFTGRHHAIIRFHQNYPRNCDTTNNPVARTVPVTIDWMFSTGHDNPLWAITYDIDQAVPAAVAGTFKDDSRAPYGELNIDGDGFSDINGTSWGDRYKFIPGNAVGTSMNLNVPWTWNTQNTVPFVKEWIDGALGAGPGYIRDATMGIVLTQTMVQQDAGGARDPNVIQQDLTVSDVRPYWTKTDADNVHSAGADKVPTGDNWPYQANGNNLSGVGGSNNARLTWKTQYGFIGQTAYNLNNGIGTTGSGWPKKSYSTYIVLGTHSSDPVGAQVAQVETIQSLTLTASTGSVVTSGPAGVTRADNVTYEPAGYNHVYGALAFQASANALDANIQVTPVTTFDVTSPASYYAFNGISGQNPPLSLVQGVTYQFNINTDPSHPFEILDAPKGSVTGNNTNLGTITFAVPASGGTFRYHCRIHDFGNTITTRGAGAGSLNKPLLILSNYTAGDPIVKLGGTTLVADTDYFASLRPSANELWITFNSNFSGTTNHIQIQPPAGLATPANFVAAATSTSNVHLSWTAVAGAANYEIYRSVNYGDVNNHGFSQLVAPFAGTTYDDAGLTQNTTYLYQVRAINGGTMSAFTATDPATTTIFADDPLNPGTTIARAAHVTQLRLAVNAMRVAAGLGTLTFDPSLASGGPIKAVYMNELRTALDLARSTIGLSAVVYTDSPTVTANVTTIKAAHITELRNGVK